MNKPVTGLYRVARGIAKPILGILLDMKISGTEHLPRDGAFLVTPNHISDFDPVVIAYFMLNENIPLRFMAKAELFKIPLLRTFFADIKMIPVHRNSQDPAAALSAARKALDEGEAVGIYPEGTLTRDPQMWPMKAKTGAARLALDTGVPVIPIAQWGAHEVIPRYRAVLNLRPKRPIVIKVLPPVDLSDLITEAGSQDHEAVKEATTRIMGAITEGVAQIRGEQPPVQPWDYAMMSGPDKKTLGRFTKWRRSLAKKGREL